MSMVFLALEWLVQNMRCVLAHSLTSDNSDSVKVVDAGLASGSSFFVFLDHLLKRI